MSNVTILASVQPLFFFSLSSDTKTFAYLNLTAEENDFKRCEYGSRTYKCSDTDCNTNTVIDLIRSGKKTRELLGFMKWSCNWKVLKADKISHCPVGITNRLIQFDQSHFILKAATHYMLLLSCMTSSLGSTHIQNVCLSSPCVYHYVLYII